MTRPAFSRCRRTAKVGADLRTALALDDTLITLKLTPNRADCLSLVGIARDVAAATGAPLTLPAIGAAPVAIATQRAVRVEDAAGCPRFVSRTIEGIDPRAPTPSWMIERLARSGIRSISAVVDITNYVMLEQGQPLHAYDDRLLDGAIVVRFAHAGEKLTLLNGQTIDLEPDLLLVCDEKKPLGLAGIMGGEHSGINDTTTTVFLEGAFWIPAVIQGQARGGWVLRAMPAIASSAASISATPPARSSARRNSSSIPAAAAPDRSATPSTHCPGANLSACAPRVSRACSASRFLRQVMATLFGRLDLTYTRDGADFLVTPPTFRFDLAIEEDFVEEIARLYGYDAIPAVPSAHVQAMLPAPEASLSEGALKRRLVARDWQEAITFSFVSSAWEASLFPDRHGNAAPIAVLNPIASHLDVMRTTLAGGLIEVLRTNLARRHERVRVFETGRCFIRTDGGCDQPLRFGGLAYGDALPEQWGIAKRALSISSTSRAISKRSSRRGRCPTERAAHPLLHPGRAARLRLDGRTARLAGRAASRGSSSTSSCPRAPGAVRARPRRPCCGGPCPRRSRSPGCPIVRRDLAVVVDEGGAAAGRPGGARRGRRRRTSTPFGCLTSTAEPVCLRARKALRFWCLCRILNVL